MRISSGGVQSEAFARFVLADDLGPSPKASARIVQAVRDYIPVAVAGASTADGRQLLAASQTLGKDGDVALLGAAARADAFTAAAFGAGIGHVLDFDDVLDVAGLHPGAMTIPVALALGAAHDIPASEVIDAITVGVEVACRLGVAAADACASTTPPWMQNTVIGPMASAAVAARLLDMRIDELLSAWGIALHLSGGTHAFAHAGATVRAIYPFLAVRAGMTAVVTAQSGFVGSSQPIEELLESFYGASADHLDDALGETFQLEQLSFKPWPSCRITHPHLATARRLGTLHGVTDRDIDSIVAYVNPVANWLCEPRDLRVAPTRSMDAKFSIPYTLGLMLTRGTVLLDMFDDAHLPDAAASAIASKVCTRDDPWTDDASPFRSRGALEILTVDGQLLSGDTTAWPGGPDDPMDDAQMIAKAASCLDFAGATDGPRAAANLRVQLERWIDGDVKTAAMYEQFCSSGAS